MSAAKALTGEQKKALARFRQRLGGLSDARKEEHKRRLAARKAIRKLLENGPATVPDLAARSGIEPREVLLVLAGMRKYGMAREEGEEGEYVRYALIAPSEGSES